MSVKQRSGLRGTMRKFRSPILNEYTPPAAKHATYFQIPEPVYEVADIYAISYDQKRKAIMKRAEKRRRITFDHSILVTTEENLINTTYAWTSELLGVGKALSDATLDRAKRDEKELAIALKELKQLHHLVKYYKGTTQTIMYLKGEFEEVYNEFKKERHLLTVKIASSRRTLSWHLRHARIWRNGTKGKNEQYKDLSTLRQSSRTETKKNMASERFAKVVLIV
jgi:hypothetical protein